MMYAVRTLLPDPAGPLIQSVFRSLSGLSHARNSGVLWIHLHVYGADFWIFLKRKDTRV